MKSANHALQKWLDAHEDNSEISRRIQDQTGPELFNDLDDQFSLLQQRVDDLEFGCLITLGRAP